MTCDDNDNIPSEEAQEKRDLKRKLDVQTFDVKSANLTYNENNVLQTKVSEECIKMSKPDTIIPNTKASLVEERQDNTKILDSKRKVMTNYSRKKRKRLEIETEFKILQSLIPKIANKQTINEVSFKSFRLTFSCSSNNKAIFITLFK